MPAKKGFGTVFKVKIASTYTELAGVTKLKPFSLKADIIDASSMDSPGQRREKLSGFSDNGQCMVELNFNNDNATHFNLISNFGSRLDCQIVFGGTPTTGQTTATFFAYPKSFDPDIPYDGKITASLVLEIDGVIVWS